MKKLIFTICVVTLGLMIVYAPVPPLGSGTIAGGTGGGGNVNSTNLYTTTNAPLPGSFYFSPDGTNGAWNSNIQAQPVGNASALYITNTGNAFAQEQFFNGTTNGGIILSATYGGFLLTQPLIVFGGYSFTNLTTGENLGFSPGLVLGNSNDVVKLDMVTSGTMVSMQLQSPVSPNQIVMNTNALILLGNAPNDSTSSNGQFTAISVTTPFLTNSGVASIPTNTATMNEQANPLTLGGIYTTLPQRGFITVSGFYTNANFAFLSNCTSGYTIRVGLGGGSTTLITNGFYVSMPTEPNDKIVMTNGQASGISITSSHYWGQ